MELFEADADTAVLKKPRSLWKDSESRRNGGEPGCQRVGVVFWQQRDEIAESTMAIASRWGYEPVKILHDGILPQDLDVVYVNGPLNSLVPIANQILNRPIGFRPSLALMLSEQLPNPGLPEWFRYYLGLARSRAERLAFVKADDGQWRVDPRWRWLTTKAHRYRYYGDLYWLKRAGILSVLGVWSQWTAEFLESRGFNPIVPSTSCNAKWGSMLNLERDIDVLWLGKIATRRRRCLLDRLRAELGERGVNVLMIDGEENDYVFGEARTILLNRSKIVLNLMREKWDDNSLRYVLAAHNGALIVTEPTLPHRPQFVSGTNIVESPTEQMTDVICHYLTHEQERKRIVDRAFQLVSSDSSSGKGVAEILEQATSVRPATVSGSNPAGPMPLGSNSENRLAQKTTLVTASNSRHLATRREVKIS